MSLEVDGGLSNPYVIASMVIWMLALLAIFIPAGVYAGRRQRLRLPVAWAVGIAIGLVIPTFLARVLIGTILYRLSNPAIGSVGFWGGASPILVPMLTATAWFITYSRVSRHVREPAA